MDAAEKPPGKGAGDAADDHNKEAEPCCTNHSAELEEAHGQIDRYHLLC